MKKPASPCEGRSNGSGSTRLPKISGVEKDSDGIICSNYIVNFWKYDDDPNGIKKLPECILFLSKKDTKEPGVRKP
jgi:hypothetical protein